MNEKSFIIFNKVYKTDKSMYLRNIVRETQLPYGTVQEVLNKNIELFETHIEGRNKYFKFKKTIENKHLFLQIELEKTKKFIQNNPKLKLFIEKTLKLNKPILIFGSYAKKTNDKSSDLDILTINKETFELPEYLSPIRVHQINIKKNQIKKLKKEILYKEIKKDYIIISSFEFFLNEVFENE